MSLIWTPAPLTLVSCSIFFTEKIGGAYYNRGLYDAQALLSKRMDDIGEAILALEKPVDFRK